MLELISRPALTVSIAEQITQAARSEAQRNGWNVSISVVDDGGHPLTLLRMDGCAPVGAYICAEKARSAAIGRRETKVYEDVVNNGRTAFLAVAGLSRGLLEGGVPIIVDGHCIGAIGVSGVKSDQDAQIARAGLAALFA